MEPLLQRIGFLQVILLIEGMDLEDLQEKSSSNTIKDHHIISDPTFKVQLYTF